MKRSNERQKWEIREHSGICDMKRKVSSLQEKEDQPKELFIWDSESNEAYN